MTKWIFIGSLVSLLAACSGLARILPKEATPPPVTGLLAETDRFNEAPAEESLAEATAPATPPDFSALFAETNQLYDQLEANTPIEVAPANASAQTMVLTMPTLF